MYTTALPAYLASYIHNRNLRPHLYFIYIPSALPAFPIFLPTGSFTWPSPFPTSPSNMPSQRTKRPPYYLAVPYLLLFGSVGWLVPRTAAWLPAVGSAQLLPIPSHTPYLWVLAASLAQQRNTPAWPARFTYPTPSPCQPFPAPSHRLVGWMVGWTLTYWLLPPLQPSPLDAPSHHQFGWLVG